MPFHQTVLSPSTALYPFFLWAPENPPKCPDFIVIRGFFSKFEKMHDDSIAPLWILWPHFGSANIELSPRLCLPFCHLPDLHLDWIEVEWMWHVLNEATQCNWTHHSGENSYRVSLRLPSIYYSTCLPDLHSTYTLWHNGWKGYD